VVDAISLIVKYKKPIVAALLTLIILNALYFSLTHFEGPSEYGDDPNYLYLGASVLNGSFHISPGYIFSTRLTEAFAVAFFYLLFGVNNLSSSLWNITSYIGIIIVTFLFVRLFYDDKAALLSAFVASVFPMVTEFAVNVGEDIPMTFVCSLAILFFLYGERFKSKAYYFGSGALLVVAWLTSYESAIVIAFVLLYALIELARKKVRLDRTGVCFICGIAFAFLIVFIFSQASSNSPFITITENLRFYSGVGKTVNGLPTIPSTNQDLMFYITAIFPYRITSLIGQFGFIGTVSSLASTIVSPMQNSEFGFYFYLVFPIMLILLLLKDKRSYFAIFWFSMLFLALEFGPMHIGISTNPLGIDYLPAYRLTRFLLIVTVPIAGIIGMGLAKLLESKNEYLLLCGALIALFVISVLFLVNYNTSNFYYYWQHYPEELVMQAVTFVKAVPATTNIYLEGTYNGANVGYSSSEINTYLGNPLGNRVNFSITENTSCSAFAAHSYVIWSGGAHCANWQDVLNITTPEDIPSFIIQEENPILSYRPTNIYYVSSPNP
jgi:4-amino-4-deoxy-L-arabinose transferase-like glycosyltransferase